MIYNSMDYAVRLPWKGAWARAWWGIGFGFYFSVMAAYFFSLWLRMRLGAKPAINLEERPGPFLRLGVALWNRVPARAKIWFSRQNKIMYEMPITRHYIAPYQFCNYPDVQEYMQRFRPYYGGSAYRSFQDFFARELKAPPRIDCDAVMPCEGLLCDIADFSTERTAKVKGDCIGLRDIFGTSGAQIPNSYRYLNVFLSNRDYHHIHAPVAGRIKKVERIPGDLVVLRPWFYRHHPSIPALLNERVNVDIEDEAGRTWFLSIVGGPVVNSILIGEGIRPGKPVAAGEKIAGFELGSTCCMAVPEEPTARKGSHVQVFQKLA